MISSTFSQQSAPLVGAEQTFKFIANTLQSFERSGSINELIGLPATDVGRFIELLESSYQEYTRQFSPLSNFCRVYHDPNNAIMEIEQRAVLAFQYLPGLEARVERYIRLDQEFATKVQTAFGDTVLQNIVALKPQTLSYEYLPSFQMFGGDIVNFADTACR